MIYGAQINVFSGLRGSYLSKTKRETQYTKMKTTKFEK